eukprot:4662715-Prymnesium_polylepis.1
MAPPARGPPSAPVLSITLHPIGGFCAISRKLPLPRRLETDIRVLVLTETNGMNATIGETVLCAAAEPHATFIRVAVIDGRQEVAYDTAVLGRLRHGFRVIQLRSLLGTRIELAYLFVCVSFAREPNQRHTSRQVRGGRLETADD